MEHNFTEHLDTRSNFRADGKDFGTISSSSMVENPARIEYEIHVG